MRPKNESLEEFKLKCFKFSLTNSAIDWYYSCAAYEGNYGDLRTKFLEKFCPPSLRLKTREKILNLEQSRDETLDEYSVYFDSIVASCPHHGFTNHYLIQRFLAGMTPLEWKKLNDAAGGSIMKLTMAETWDLIDELAESTKQGPMHQTDDEAPTEDEDPQITEEEPPQSDPVLITNPSEEITVLTVEPTKVPNLTAEAVEEIKPGPVLALEAPEEVPDLIAELSEKDLILIVGAPETDLVLMVEVPQLKPSYFMPIIATEDHIINDDAVQGELEAEHEPKKPTKEISLVTSQEKPPGNSIIPRQPFVATTKKRPHMGTCLWSPMFEGTKPNFQTRESANYSNMKKRQRHGPKEWKPGRSNKQARRIGPAAMVKETSPSRSKRAAEKKFDLTHPWDPTL
ncbi:unnamed protein product [Rhodiola kirilowii]